METREIKITLETAMRMYEQGGEFREMALGAFTEKELIGCRLPKTWEEFCISKGDEGIRINAALNFAYVSVRKAFADYHDAEKHIAQMKLHLLRDEYRNGWHLENRNLNIVPYTIFSEHEWDSCRGCYKVIYKVEPSALSSQLLEFQDEETANEFLNNFRELIEQAGDLI